MYLCMRACTGYHSFTSNMHQCMYARDNIDENAFYVSLYTHIYEIISVSVSISVRCSGCEDVLWYLCM